MTPVNHDNYNNVYVVFEGKLYRGYIENDYIIVTSEGWGAKFALKIDEYQSLTKEQAEEIFPEEFI